MRLLIAVITDEAKLDPILHRFMELGVTGATIVQTEGMGTVLQDELPVFASLQTLVAGARDRHRTILSVMADDLADAALDAILDVCGDLTVPGSGVAFTLPVDRAVGLTPKRAPPPK